MAREFRCIGSWTEFSSEGTLNKDLFKTVCFAAATHCVAPGQRASNSYKIKIYKGTTMATTKYASNNCLLDKSTLERHINFALSIIKFKYDIEEYDEYFIVNLNLSGEVTKHTFVLSWIRYSYEFPYNVATFDMYRLCDVKPFKQVNLFTLFNLISASLSLPGAWGGQSIGRGDIPSKYVTVNQLRDRVNHTKKIHYSVNQILTPLTGECVSSYRPAGWKLVPNRFEELYDTSTWYDDAAFASRCQIYENNLHEVITLS